MKVFNENGVLPPGFFEYKLEEIEKNFVNDFTESQTREKIFNGFKIWIKELLKVVTPEEIWLDGSFTTSKVNPNDIDIIVFNNYQDANKDFNILQKLGHENFCDTYYAIEPNDELPYNQDLINFRNYWRGQFGFDRQDIPKGMIKISKEEIIRIREVIRDV